MLMIFNCKFNTHIHTERALGVHVGKLHRPVPVWKNHCFPYVVFLWVPCCFSVVLSDLRKLSRMMKKAQKGNKWKTSLEKTAAVYCLNCRKKTPGKKTSQSTGLTLIFLCQKTDQPSGGSNDRSDNPQNQVMAFLYKAYCCCQRKRSA